MDEAILKTITDHYLKSRDFNGIRLDAITGLLPVKMAFNDLIDTLIKLIVERRATIVFGDINPHIKRSPDRPVEEQVKRLNEEKVFGKGTSICIYPAEEVICAAIDTSEYDDRPFTKRLLLGEPQLKPVYFDLHVLDRYHSDPRYYYSFNDCDGSICVSDEYFESEDMPERDQVLLQTFGIGYDSDKKRVVVVLLRYLSDLSPEHQRIWQADMINSHCNMVYEYYLNKIVGDWGDCMPLYQAILEEQTVLNQLATIIGKPLLFRKTFTERPRAFSSLLRPTLKSYLEFVHLFDKLLSDNINKDFFLGDLPLEEQLSRKDGTVEVRQRGTLQLLDAWLHKVVLFSDEQVYKDIIEPFQEVRKIRNRPAHSVVKDEYDTDYIRQQDDLVDRVHKALAGLCIILSTHPKVKISDFVLPDWLPDKVKAF